MIPALVILPALAGATAFILRDDPLRRRLLVGTAAAHSALTALAWMRPLTPGGWFGLDALGLVFLSLISLLFLSASVYALHYLAHDEHGEKADADTGAWFDTGPEAVFIGCLLFFLATMSLVCLSRHFGLLWVAIEATTLATAPLIYFHRSDRSLEATWKYLLLCSVGIALALLGTYFLAVSASGPRGALPLTVQDLMRHAGDLHAPWLRAAFLLLLVGYGTKMGLAPMHTWLPDAHSESPSLVSALLSGALLNCAFLGILRIQQVNAAAGEAAFGREALLVFGLISMAMAAVFILGQADFKRLLAYSSVEHMGILALGVGVGGAGAFGSVFHAVNHSLTKGMLFLAAGNLLAAYSTKTALRVRGVLKALPVTGWLWIAGFFAITGTPPFGTFFSELTILQAILQAGKIGTAAVYLVLLAVVFIGMASIMLRMAQGEPADGRRPAAGSEPWLAVAPAVVLASLALALGLYLPPAVGRVLLQAASGL